MFAFNTSEGFYITNKNETRFLNETLTLKLSRLKSFFRTLLEYNGLSREKIKH
jgi:hypothetical protein